MSFIQEKDIRILVFNIEDKKVPIYLFWEKFLGKNYTQKKIEIYVQREKDIVKQSMKESWAA
jgi:hypothetical protein